MNTVGRKMAAGMNPKKLICTGGIGSVIVALCCFTPILVVLLGAAGLSAWLGWIDYVLLPSLALFLGVTAYGLWLRRQAAIGCTTESKSNKESARHV